MNTRFLSLGIFPLVFFAGGSTLAAQTVPATGREDSVLVTPNPDYAGGRLKSWLLGTDYRDLWTVPVRVPVLDLATHAGGIEPTKKGGGLQTTSLRFRGANGREYVFRSLNKRPHLAAHPDLAGTLVGRLIQDQTGSMHPGAVLISAAVLESLGVPHPNPRLVVMPDDPCLGEFRQEFAGMLGTIEERPNEGEDGAPGFGGFTRIIGTDELLEKLAEDPSHRVDASAYLTARLADLFLGDWDRHEDQWRWGRTERDGRTVWVPIPRDRDYALVNYDGLVLGLVRRAVANAVALRPDYTNLAGLTLNAKTLDRRLLAELPRPVWNATALALRDRLADEVIDSALLRLPPEYRERGTDRLAELLRQRRDALPEGADAFYRSVAGVVYVHGTDRAELAELDRLADGGLRVRLFARDKDGRPAADPYFDRTLVPGETQEVRIFLADGDDHATLRGVAAAGIKARLVGEGGNDTFVNASWVRGPGTGVSVHDEQGSNRVFGFQGIRVDRGAFSPPPDRTPVGRIAVRDQGSVFSIFSPFADWESDLGLLVGGGPTYTRYGFRRHPYAFRVQARGMYALRAGGFAADLRADARPTNSALTLEGYARASQIEQTRFYGWGNGTPRPEGNLFRVDQTALRVGAGVRQALGDNVVVSAGPVLQHAWTDAAVGSPLELEAPLGVGSFGQIGVEGQLRFDRGDHALLPRRAFHAVAEATAFHGGWSAPGAFGRVGGTTVAHLPVPGPLEPTLSLRAGGEWAWGDFPFFEAAYLGSAETLRGYARQRFAGDAAVYGGAELRAFLTRAKLLVVRGDLGAILLTDAGRVFHDGESPDGWHTAWGGGLWFGLLDRSLLVRATYVYGEAGKFYLSLGRAW